MIVLGADPEVLLFRRGKCVPAHLYYPPKEHGLQPSFMGKLFRDGWALELNPTPSPCIENLVLHVKKLLLVARGEHPGTSIRTVSSARVDLKFLETAPPDVLITGCDQAWNAYSNTMTSASYRDSDIRCAGGHMHISASSSLEKEFSWFHKHDNVRSFAKLCDRFVGLLNTYLFGGEPMALRRRLYGKAGEFRYQRYPHSIAGFEYRTPGPELFSSPVSISLHFWLFRFLWENFQAIQEKYPGTYERQVAAVINAGYSREDILDLIPELPAVYTKAALKALKADLTRRERGYSPNAKHWSPTRGWHWWSTTHFGLYPTRGLD